MVPTLQLNFFICCFNRTFLSSPLPVFNCIKQSCSLDNSSKSNDMVIITEVWSLKTPSTTIVYEVSLNKSCTINSGKRNEISLWMTSSFLYLLLFVWPRPLQKLLRQLPYFRYHSVAFLNLFAQRHDHQLIRSM